MPDPLHHSTMAAITRMAQARGLPIVRADDEVVIVGDVRVENRNLGNSGPTGWYTSGEAGPLQGPIAALRHALGETPRA